MPDEDHTTPDTATQEEERREGRSAHGADRAATDEETEAAERSRDRFAGDAADVAAHEKSMSERGANVKGEGEID
jgi:hypothetical protein